MLPHALQSHTTKSRWVMHMRVALPWVHLFPCLVGAVTVVSAKAACLTDTLP